MIGFMPAHAFSTAVAAVVLVGIAWVLLAVCLEDGDQ